MFHEQQGRGMVVCRFVPDADCATQTKAALPVKCFSLLGDCYTATWTALVFYMDGISFFRCRDQPSGVLHPLHRVIRLPIRGVLLRYAIRATSQPIAPMPGTCGDRDFPSIHIKTCGYC